MLNKEEIMQYAVEMKQICSSYILGQKTTAEFLGCCQKFDDYISSIDSYREQNCLCECKYPVPSGNSDICVKCGKAIIQKPY